jgi:hypothetical protein
VIPLKLGEHHARGLASQLEVPRRHLYRP